jgi:hypothetical protein
MVAKTPARASHSSTGRIVPLLRPYRLQVAESGSQQDLLREEGLYASLYEEQFEGGHVQWRCPDGDIMTDGTVRPRDPQPASS